MIVIDTHVLVWAALVPERLSATARQVLAAANEGEGSIVADISLWEIAMLIKKNRLHVDINTQDFLTLLLEANKHHVQPITTAIAALSVALPTEVTGEPADRLIAATTLALGASLLTADRNLRDYDALSTRW